MTYAQLALKFGPYLAIALLIGVFFWVRGDKIAAEGERDAAKAQVVSLTDANKSLKDALTVVKQQRVDNDAIAEAVAAKLSGNNVREVHTREVIKEAIRNDPQVRNWADTAIPDSVRQAIRTRSIDAPAR